MTKEELEKEAEVFAEYYESLFPNEFETFYKAFLKVAEPREKQITVLSKHIIDLQKDKGNLTDKVRELEQQIEKMKRDVMRNVKWADQNKNEQMYCKLNAMINQWEIKNENI